MMKAIIFDFDGTIIDTETAWYEAFREAYEQHGVELTLQQYSTCIGTSLHSFNPYEYLMTDLGLPIDKDAFRQSIRARHAELMQKETMRPGVKAYLEAAKARGLRIGLATSSERAWIDKHLKQLGLEDVFECIKTADDVRTVKPDPELYVQALECLGVMPNEAVAIEDSPNGAKAAFNAGMHVVLVPNAITQYLEFTGEPLFRAAALSDIPFEDVLAHQACS